MSRICLSNVKDLQSMEAVGDLLKEGIESICKICASLFDAHADLNTGYNQIRKHIEHAEHCLTRSEEMIKEKLRGLNECMEHLLKEVAQIEQEKKKKNIVMDKLRKEKANSENILYNSKRALEQTKKKLALEKEAVEKEEASVTSSAVLTGVGAAVLPWPGIGWIAGPIMLSVGASGLHEALSSIKESEEEIRKAECQIREYNHKVSDYQSRIFKVQNEIEKTKEDLSKIKEETDRLKQNQRAILEIQKTVRQAVHLLSVLSGRVSVLEKQTQLFITCEPVMKLMKEVMKAALDIAENQLFYSRGLSGFINTLRENMDRTLAICNSPSNSEYESYY